MSNMEIATMTFRLHVPWVHSLKEKRMIVKSIIAKIQNKFHVSVSEIDEQDIHQIIVIGVAAIVPHNAMADSLMDEISSFVEENTEAEILDEMLAISSEIEAWRAKKDSEDANAKYNEMLYYGLGNEEANRGIY